MGVLLMPRDPVFTGRVLEAIAYASEVHAGDVRKGVGTPYLAHLLSAAALVAEEKGDEQQVIGALLHDTAEDHGGEARLEEIERKFGPGVRDIVEGCSDSLVAEGVEKEHWRTRKERYLEHLRTTDNVDVLRVCNADKVHNARAIVADLREEGSRLWERFSTKSADDQLVLRLPCRDPARAARRDMPLVRELEITVAAMCEAA